MNVYDTAQEDLKQKRADERLFVLGILLLILAMLLMGELFFPIPKPERRKHEKLNPNPIDGPSTAHVCPARPGRNAS
jgi:hypothetical protein